MNRPLCPACKQRFCAVNCYKNDRVYYRSRCDTCIRKNRRIPATEPKWKALGYKKKTVCDRCGFRSKHASQVLVYHVDGNLNNNSLRNLRTICLNCVEEVKRLDRPWTPGDLELDR